MTRKHQPKHARPRLAPQHKAPSALRVVGGAVLELIGAFIDFALSAL